MIGNARRRNPIVADSELELGAEYIVQIYHYGDHFDLTFQLLKTIIRPAQLVHYGRDETISRKRTRGFQWKA